MHAISSYRGNRPTNKQTGTITIHCAAGSTQCNYEVEDVNARGKGKGKGPYT